jgi:hypothetical protein
LTGSTDGLLKLLPENISVGVGLQSGLHLDSFLLQIREPVGLFSKGHNTYNKEDLDETTINNNIE